MERDQRARRPIAVRIGARRATNASNQLGSCSLVPISRFFRIIQRAKCAEKIKERTILSGCSPSSSIPPEACRRLAVLRSYPPEVHLTNAVFQVDGLNSATSPLVVHSQSHRTPRPTVRPSDHGRILTFTRPGLRHSGGRASLSPAAQSRRPRVNQTWVECAARRPQGFGLSDYVSTSRSVSIHVPSERNSFRGRPSVAVAPCLLRVQPPGH